MLHLYDINKNKIKGLKLYKDMNIESTLSTGDKVLSFLYPARLAKDIKEECYIRTKTAEFVVKEIADQGEWKSIKAVLNVEDLEGKEWEHFDTTEQTIEQCINLALAGTGWIIGTCNVTKKRTVRKTNCSTWDIIQEAKKIYRVELEFDTINKKINIAEKLGTDKGVYFMDSLNLRSLDIQSNSYDFYTRMIAKGKDKLKVTVENYQYSKKKKTIIWQDERYTDINSLTEDATAKLEELSKPYKAYGADVIDLANMSNKYSILSYGLGDTITLISKEKGIKENQRIVKIVEYPEEPELNTCEIANTLLKFEDIQKEFQDTADTVNNITEDNGTIREDSIRTAVEHITINKADIQSLNAAVARIGTLEVTSATITQLNASNAKIEDLYATRATIKDLEANTGKITVLESRAASIENILSGNIGAENIQAGAIQAGSSIIAEGAIGSAQISSLSASKLSAGIIDAAVITVKNLNADNITVGSINGQRIAPGAIDNSKVSATANIDGSKLNINSVVVAINSGTTQINGTKIQVGDRTLDVELSTQKIAVDNNAESISSQGAKISALDSAIKLKVDSQTYNTEKAELTNLVNSKATADALNNLQKTTTNALETMKAETQKSIDSISIGGRNLLLDSARERTSSREYVGVPITNIALNNLNKEITISFDLKAAIHGSIAVYALGRYSWTGSKNFNISTEYTRQFITVIPTDKGEGYPNGNVCILSFYGTYDTGIIPTIKNIKIELGNKPTDWTPAPEDVEQQLADTEQALQSNIDNAKLELNNTLNATKTELTTNITNAVKDRVTTDQLTTIQNAINTKVAEVETLANNGLAGVDEAKNLINDLKNTTISTINSTLSKATSDISILQKQIISKVEQTDIDKAITNVQLGIDSSISAINTKIDSANSEINQLKNQIVAKVETSIFESFQTSINGEITNTKSRLSTTEQSISIMQGQIATKVTQTDIDKSIGESKTIPDTRNENQPPSWYWSNYKKQVVTEFKYRNVMGAPGVEIYGSLQTTVPWSDSSGGSITQVFRSEDGTYERASTSTSSWSAWKQIEDTQGSQDKIDDYNRNIVAPIINRVNTAESSITQMGNQIASKVDVNGVKSIMEQNPSSIKVGFNGIDDNVEVTEKGTIFKHPDLGTKTRVDAKGFGIYNIDDVNFEDPLGSFWGSGDAGFENVISTEIRADKIYADNIESVQEQSVTYYVRPGYGDNSFEGTMFDAPFDSVNYALSKINKIIPMGVEVTINVYDTVYERIVIEGFRGGGTLNINFDANAKLYSKVTAICINCDFSMNGGRTGYNANNGCMVQTTDEHGIEFENVNKYYLRGFRGNGIQDKNKYIYMFHAESSKGSVLWLDSYGYYGQIYSSNQSITRVYDNRGKGSFCYLAYTGSIILGGHDSGTMVAPLGSRNIQNGGIIDIKGTVNGADSLWHPTTEPPPPVPTKKIYTKSWSATSTQSWRDSYGWRSDNRYIYQGSYGYGNHRGFICFNDSDIRTQLSGATIKSARLYLKRRNAGGSSASQRATMYLHNYSSTGGGYSIGSKIGSTVGYAWGTGTWSSIPVSAIQALQNGSARGIALYVSGSPYMIFEATATLEITYEK